MRMLLKIAPALCLAAGGAFAADNLECQGPFGEVAEPPAFTAPVGRVTARENGMICPPIPSNAAVTAVECLVRVAAPSKPETTFRCPADAPCPGVGAFQKIERFRGPMGLDQLCATYSNDSDNPQTFGVRATLAR